VCGLNKETSPRAEMLVYLGEVCVESGMISRLRGTVVEVDGDTVVIDVQGVGYQVTCTSGLLAEVECDAERTICVYTDVKEDSIRLFGFASSAERTLFLLLNKVSGMGPRSSLDVVSNVPVRDLLRAIGSGDVAALMSIKGVGKKKAERIVVELKDLVASMVEERSTIIRSSIASGRDSLAGVKPASSDAVAALEVLGFPRRDAEIAVSKAVDGGWAQSDVGDLVREALRYV
jgi:Holliday junction DNA helicase RuvA